MPVLYDSDRRSGEWDKRAMEEVGVTVVGIILVTFFVVFQSMFYLLFKSVDGRLKDIAEELAKNNQE